MSESQRREYAKHVWRTLCDHVDPAIRRGLRFYRDSRLDLRADCGAGIALTVGYTGDTGQMAAPTTITGTPRAVATHGRMSIVMVTMHYRARDSDTAPPPPGSATIKVLVVKRDDRWWVATPRAFNPLVAADGGAPVAAQRAYSARLLAAAK